MERVTQKDVDRAPDQFCGVCKTKKTKYLGKILGTPAVLFSSNCSCSPGSNHQSKTDKDRKMWEHINTPYWRLMGLKPKPKDIKMDQYLKSRGMTYGDFRKERDYAQGKYQSAYGEFEKHVNKYGRKNAPNEALYEKDN